MSYPKTPNYVIDCKIAVYHSLDYYKLIKKSYI